MKIRPLTALAFVLLGFGGFQISKTVFDTKNAFAEENGAEKTKESAQESEKPPEESAAPVAEITPPPMCLPVDLAKEAGISAGEFRLLENLQERRQVLDSRERDIITREGILKTAEAIVQAKIDNLKEVEGNIQKLLGQVDEMEAQRIAGLVRVYEKMKPKDAARVLEGLSDEVVVTIASKMKDQTLALILAKMDAKRAREITAKLAQIDDGVLQQAMNPQSNPKPQTPNNSKLPPVQNPPAQGAGPQAPQTPGASSPVPPDAKSPVPAPANGQKSDIKPSDKAANVNKPTENAKK